MNLPIVAMSANVLADDLARFAAAASTAMSESRSVATNSFGQFSAAHRAAA
jgi:hypothetical protein